MYLPFSLFPLPSPCVFTTREPREFLITPAFIFKLVTSSEFILIRTRIDRLFSFYILTLAFRLKLRTQSHFTYIRYSKTEGQPRLTRLSTIPVLCPDRFSHALVTLFFSSFSRFSSHNKPSRIVTYQYFLFATYFYFPSRLQATTGK